MEQEPAEQDLSPEMYMINGFLDGEFDESDIVDGLIDPNSDIDQTALLRKIGETMTKIKKERLEEKEGRMFDEDLASRYEEAQDTTVERLSRLQEKIRKIIV